MQTEDFRPRLRGIGKLIATLLTQLLGLVLNSIKDVELRLMAQGLIGSAQKTVDALADNDPNDGDQLRAIFNQLLEDGPFKQGSQAKLLAAIGKLPDADVRIFLSILSTNSYPVADLLTDDVPENADQVRDHLRQLLRSPDGQVFLRSAFGIILPDNYADTLSIIAMQLLYTVLEEEGDTETASNLLDLRTIYEARVVASLGK